MRAFAMVTLGLAALLSGCFDVAAERSETFVLGADAALALGVSAGEGDSLSLRVVVESAPPGTYVLFWSPSTSYEPRREDVASADSMAPLCTNPDPDGYTCRGEAGIGSPVARVQRTTTGRVELEHTRQRRENWPNASYYVLAAFDAAGVESLPVVATANALDVVDGPADPSIVEVF